MAHAEYETHDFRSARDHAKELTEYEPRRGLGFQLLGDASLELGDYEGAVAAYKQMEQLDPGTVPTESRLARLALLRGDQQLPNGVTASALAQAKSSPFPSAETIAWCHWQLGEVSLATGDYERAEGHYRDALGAFPEYPHAVTSLARLRAAKGDLAGAIATFEELVQKYSDPIDGAVLGDLYKLSGRQPRCGKAILCGRTIESTKPASFRTLQSASRTLPGRSRSKGRPGICSCQEGV